MNRDKMIKKAQEIENKYYEMVKETEEIFGNNSKQYLNSCAEWGAAREAMCELLGLTVDEEFKYFFNC